MTWDRASVVIADVWGGERKLLARAVGYYLGSPAADWLVVGSGTLVPAAALSNVEVALW